MKSTLRPWRAGDAAAGLAPAHDDGDAAQLRGRLPAPDHPDDPRL